MGREGGGSSRASGWSRRASAPSSLSGFPPSTPRASPPLSPHPLPRASLPPSPEGGGGGGRPALSPEPSPAPSGGRPRRLAPAPPPARAKASSGALRRPLSLPGACGERHRHNGQVLARSRQPLEAVPRQVRGGRGDGRRRPGRDGRLGRRLKVKLLRHAIGLDARMASASTLMAEMHPVELAGRPPLAMTPGRGALGGAGENRSQVCRARRRCSFAPPFRLHDLVGVVVVSRRWRPASRSAWRRAPTRSAWPRRATPAGMQARRGTTPRRGDFVGL